MVMCKVSEEGFSRGFDDCAILKKTDNTFCGFASAILCPWSLIMQICNLKILTFKLRKVFNTFWGILKNFRGRFLRFADFFILIFGNDQFKFLISLKTFLKKIPLELTVFQCIISVGFSLSLVMFSFQKLLEQLIKV